MPQTLLEISADGRLRFVWDDRLADLVNAGETRVRRASHVEPAPGGWGWIADLTPSGGPVVGPFRLRREALAAEVRWIQENALRAQA
jgi:hypothetical protein